METAISSSSSIYKASNTLNPGYYLFTVNIKADDHSGLNIANDVFTIRTLANGRTFTFEGSYFLTSEISGIAINDQTSNTPSITCSITSSTSNELQAVVEGIVPTGGSYSWYLNGQLIPNENENTLTYDITEKTFGAYQLTAVWKDSTKTVVWSDSDSFLHNAYPIAAIPEDAVTAVISLSDPNTDEVFKLIESSNNKYLISYPESLTTWFVKEFGDVNPLSGNPFWRYLSIYYPDVSQSEDISETATEFFRKYMLNQQYLEKPINSENAKDWCVPYLSNDWDEVYTTGEMAGFTFNNTRYSVRNYKDKNGETFTATDETFFRVVTDGTDYKYYFEFPVDIYDAYTKLFYSATSNTDIFKWYAKHYYNKDISSDSDITTALIKEMFSSGHVSPVSELVVNCETSSASTTMQTITSMQPAIKINNPNDDATEYVMVIKENSELDQTGNLSVFSLSSIHLENEAKDQIFFSIPIQSESNSDDTIVFYIGNIKEDLFTDEISFHLRNKEQSLFGFNNFGSVQMRPATDAEKNSAITKTFSEDGILTVDFLKNQSYLLSSRNQLCVYVDSYDQSDICNCTIKAEFHYLDENGNPVEYVADGSTEVYYNSSHTYNNGYSGLAAYGSYSYRKIDHDAPLECIGIYIPNNIRNNDIKVTLTILEKEETTKPYYDMLLINPNNGEEPYYVQYVDNVVELPTAPNRSNYNFCGWYNQFGQLVTKDIEYGFGNTITAKWEKVE